VRRGRMCGGLPPTRPCTFASFFLSGNAHDLCSTFSSISFFLSFLCAVRRFLPRIDELSDALAEMPASDQGQVAKLLRKWWDEGVFPAAVVAKLQGRFKEQAAPSTGRATAGAEASGTGHSAAVGGPLVQTTATKDPAGSGKAIVEEDAATSWPSSATQANPSADLGPPPPPMMNLRAAAGVGGAGSEGGRKSPGEGPEEEDGEQHSGSKDAAFVPPLPPEEPPRPPPDTMPPGFDGAVQPKRKRRRWE
jgi:hypothetical protein